MAKGKKLGIKAGAAGIMAALGGKGAAPQPGVSALGLKKGGLSKKKGKAKVSKTKKKGK